MYWEIETIRPSVCPRRGNYTFRLEKGSVRWREEEEEGEEEKKLISRLDWTETAV